MARAIFPTDEALDFNEINRAMQRASQLRAEAFNSALRSIYRILTRRTANKKPVIKQDYRHCTSTS